MNDYVIYIIITEGYYSCLNSDVVGTMKQNRVSTQGPLS